MTLFEEVAKNYNIADREFTMRLTGAEVLALISLIQLGRATSTPSRFEETFPGVVPIAKGLIEVVSEVDGQAGDQLRKGWKL